MEVATLRLVSRVLGLGLLQEGLLPRSLSEYCLLKGGFEEYGGPWFPVTRDGEIVA